MGTGITKGEIIEINRKVTSSYGEAFGMINEGNLDFLSSKIVHIEDPFRAAAELLCGIARGHPFLDGNKRTAYQSASLHLEKSGIDLAVDPEEGETFMLKAASSESLTLKEAREWIRSHSGKHG